MANGVALLFMNNDGGPVSEPGKERVEPQDRDVAEREERTEPRKRSLNLQQVRLEHELCPGLPVVASRWFVT